MSVPTISFEDGAAYDSMMGVWTQYVGTPFLSWLNLDQGGRWLDVGCGTGAFTQQIIDSCKPSTIDGIDPSSAQIEFARNRDRASPARFRIGDAMALPYGDDAFDVTTMALVIFFVPQPALSVAEMSRVTSPGGTIATYVWDVYGGGMPPEPIFEALRDMNIDHPLPPSAKASRSNELLRLWQAVGLRDIEQQAFSVERSFESFDSFWNITTSSASLQGVFAGMDSKSVQKVRQRVHDGLPVAADGSITYAAHANAIKGTA